ncbi:LacI family DNA-binding transcriptional regulator [Stappia sp. F7233]|uniref:LacI family DNA-binding transcriptional regulator n=1 Tax=Stappia albiluteola TaxID=2758565 RepID=A0A839AEP9_9HYPH|nr:LacI family DNA-binding transcriptional regulator [Stappia albiluteola]MBA5777372.1 LacI family DNA-binding transcriptional regulator [Stappia albiluteola]
MNQTNGGRTPGQQKSGRRVTLGDIAADLGVSTATVSLALRDSPLVAEETLRRVKAHAQSIGYIYNRHAATLRTARSDMIGIAVHDILNPYFAEIFQVLEDELGQRKRVVLICNHRDEIERQGRFIDALLQHRVDGLVLCAAIGTTASDLARLEAAGIPVTLICREVEGAMSPVVRGDDLTGSYLVTRHLLEQGHRRISMIGGRQESSTGRDRFLGWRKALAEFGVDPDTQHYIPDLMTQADGLSVAEDLLRCPTKPTAVVAFNDLVAAGLSSGLRRAERNISIVGYDDTQRALEQSPPLTSVDNRAGEIARRAAAMMLRQIDGEDLQGEKVFTRPELKVRESSPPPGDGIFIQP